MNILFQLFLILFIVGGLFSLGCLLERIKPRDFIIDKVWNRRWNKP